MSEVIQMDLNKWYAEKKAIRQMKILDKNELEFAAVLIGFYENKEVNEILNESDDEYKLFRLKRYLEKLR